MSTSASSSPGLSMGDMRSPDRSMAAMPFTQLHLAPPPASSGTATTATMNGKHASGGGSNLHSPASPSPVQFGSVSPMRFDFPGSGGQQQAQQVHPLSPSFSRQLSPRGSQLADSYRSLSSATHSQLLSASATPAQALQPKNAALMSDMLHKAREALHRLQAELEVERQRRQTSERDLADVRRELSNERLAGSSSAHSVQLQHDKEARLLRELAAQKLLETSLRQQLAEEADALTREKEERIRLSERLERVGSELRSAQDQLRSREEELLSLRKQGAAESARAALALQESANEAARAKEELRLKSAALKETEEVMKQIDAQLAQLDSQKSARESQRALEEQRLQSRIAELQGALDTATAHAESNAQSNEMFRAENARLVGLVRENSAQMSRQYENAAAEVRRSMEEQLAECHRRIDALSEQEQRLSREVHDAAVSNASLTARLQAKSTEAEHATAELAELKSQLSLLIAEHAQHVEALQATYKQHVADVESHARHRDSSATEEQRHAYELALQSLERDVERALTSATQAVLDPSSSSSSATFSSFASSFDAASASLSPRRSSGQGLNRHHASHSGSTPRSGVKSDHASGGSGGGDSLAFFYTSSLSLFKEQLLHRLASSFRTLHQARVDAEAAASRTEKHLRDEVAQLRMQVASVESAAQDESRRHQAEREEHAREVRSLQQAVAGGQQETLLLEERASVIRELKRRYRKEQAQSAALGAQVAQLRSQLQAIQASHTDAEVSWRRSSAAELQAVLRNAESIASKRLEAESRLRRKAEEEAERYVHACQQSEQRVSALQQQQTQLLALFRQTGLTGTSPLHAGSSVNGNGTSGIGGLGGSAGLGERDHAESEFDARFHERLRRFLKYSSSAAINAALKFPA